MSHWRPVSPRLQAEASEEPDLAIPHLSAEPPAGAKGLDHGHEDVDQLLTFASPRGGGHLDVDDAVAEDTGSDGNDSGLEGAAQLIEGKDVTGAKKRRRHHDELAKVLRAEMSTSGAQPLTSGALAAAESTAPSSTQTPQDRPGSALGVRGLGSELQSASMFDSPDGAEVSRPEVAAPPAYPEPVPPRERPAPLLSKRATGSQEESLSRKESLPRGTKVTLQDIRSSPQLNGVAATVIRLDPTDGTYVVELEEAEGRPQKQVQVPRAKLMVVLETPKGRQLPNKAFTPTHLGVQNSPLDDNPTPLSKNTMLSEYSLKTEESGTLGTRLGYDSTSPMLVAMKGYSRLVVACPCCMIVMYIVLVCLVIVIAWRPFQLEMDFSAFISADGDASRQRQAYLAALDEKKAPVSAYARRLQKAGPVPDAGEGEPGAGRRLAANRVVNRLLTVVYSAKDGRAFEEKVLRNIHSFETRLREEMEEVCSMSLVNSNDHSYKCNPGVTFDRFAWPTQTQLGEYSTRGNFEINFDAGGSDLLPLEAVLLYMDQEQNSRDYAMYNPRYFPREYVVPSPYDDVSAQQPTAIRSQFFFKLHAGDIDDSAAVSSQKTARVKEAYESMIRDKVHPVLSEEAAKYDHIDVYYEGDYIDTYEVTLALMNDCLWAVGSMVFVTVYMWIHIGIPTGGFWKFVFSFVFSLMCIVIIFASIPVAYVLAPSSKTTVASFLSLFLMAGIGSDTVFVCVDFWEQSKELKHVKNRVVFLLTHAGKSCLATSLTTSISFFANLASVLQPLREFGLFMGLCVMSAFVLVILFLPPLLVIRELMLAPAPSSKIHSAASLKDKQGSSGAGAGPCGGCRRKKAGQDRQPVVAVLLFKQAGWIANCSLSVLAVTFCLALVFMVGVSVSAEMEEAVPTFFPDDHNQVQGKKVIESFQTVGEVDEVVSTGGRCSAVAGAQRRVTKYVGEFDDTKYLGSLYTSADCTMYWCDASEDLSQDGEGTCYLSPTYWDGAAQVALPPDGGDNLSCESLHVTSRLQLQHGWQPSADAVREAFREAAARVAGDLDLQDPTFGTAVPVVLEDWESGDVSTEDLYEVSLVSLGASGAGICQVDMVCFAGERTCKPTQLEQQGWQPLGPFGNFTEDPSSRRLAAAEIPAAGPPQARAVVGPLPAAPAAPRSLSAIGTLVRNPFDVAVVFGIRPPLTTPLVGAQEETWIYDPDFDAGDPWAQRSMLKVCTELPNNLLVITAQDSENNRPRCWIESFKTYLAEVKEKPFPSRDFEDDVYDWWQVKREMGEHFTWFEVESGINKMKACTMQFYVNLDKDSVSAAKALDYMKLWDEFLARLNGAASLSASRAWHTASVWVRAEAEEAIISSTVEIIVIACVCAWFGVLIFTQDPVLAMQVTGLVVIIILGLAFFMICLMGWAVGAVEVISLVVFVGYSVTYSLHIAHNYSEAQQGDTQFAAIVKKLVRRRNGSWSGADAEGSKYTLNPRGYREVRTRMALKHVGGAVLSSATSTVGSAMFLLFCTLNIFVKLGLVVIAVTMLSIVVAVVALPAGLIRFGPGRDPCYRRKSREAWSGLRAAATRWSGSRPPPPDDAAEREPLVVEVLEVLF